MLLWLYLDDIYRYCNAIIRHFEAGFMTQQQFLFLSWSILIREEN